MSEQASGALSGAAAGASAGAAAGPWGALIGAGVGAIGGYFGGASARKKEREQQRLEERIMNMLGIKKYSKFYNQYLPLVRSQIASATGPQFAQAVGANIASRGLYNTGLGAALGNAAILAPGIAAQSMAGGMARNTQLDKARALGAQISRRQDVPINNPLLDTITGGLRGYYGARGVGQPMGQTQPGTDQWTQQGYLPDLFPGLGMPKKPVGFDPMEGFY